MGSAKNMATKEYTHAYRMWNIIGANDCTWVRFMAHFQEAYLNREELELKAGTEKYESDNNVKHGKIEHSFMNFFSATAASNADFTKMTTTNGSLYTQLRQEEQILSLQAELCNLDVASATQPINMKTYKTGQPYTNDKKQK